MQAIPVSERVPDCIYDDGEGGLRSTPVLAWDGDTWSECIYGPNYFGGPNVWTYPATCAVCQISNLAVGGVTHWMPMPPAPKHIS